jgi:hypothetical protein
MAARFPGDSRGIASRSRGPGHARWLTHKLAGPTRERRQLRAPSDTPQGLKPHGFSVHPPSHRRESPKALSKPVDVQRCVPIAVHNESTVRADVCANAQTLVDALATSAAVLRGVRWRHRFHSLAGACCLESEDREEGAPSSVLKAFVEASFLRGPVVLVAAILVLLWCGTAAQIGRRDRLHVDGVVPAHQRQRRRVVEVAPLAAHVLMPLGTPAHGFRAALTALLAARDMLLGFLQCFLRFALVARIRNRLPIRRDEKHLEAHINAGLAVGRRQRLGGYLRTREAHVPAIRLLGEGDGLG